MRRRRRRRRRGRRRRTGRGRRGRGRREDEEEEEEGDDDDKNNDDKVGNIYSAAEQALVLKRDFAAPRKLNSITSKQHYTKQVSRFSAVPLVVYSVIFSTRAMISVFCS
jgi:hypothetical protein